MMLYYTEEKREYGRKVQNNKWSEKIKAIDSFYAFLVTTFLPEQVLNKRKLLRAYEWFCLC